MRGGARGGRGGRVEGGQGGLAGGVGFSLSRFSGVVFRKGCLGTLGALNVPGHRLADHADHADVASSRLHPVDTVSQRPGNSDLIASAF